jgi:dolichyl-phosphate-mannose-protein mannosyltransferase
MNGAVLTPGSFPALPAILRWCRTQIEAQPMERIAMGSLLGLLIVGGALLRVQGVGFPAYFTFDEELFVRNAHNYLLGLPDANDHPPLGKLVMAVGMALFGYNSLGWRFASVCFGLQSVLMAYWLAAQLFDRRAGWLAAAFVAADGFFISYSRAGLLDGMLSCLVLWGVLAAVASRSWLGTLASAMRLRSSGVAVWQSFPLPPPSWCSAAPRKPPSCASAWPPSSTPHCGREGWP